ncbi:MAG: ABC transporter permease subunit [Geobacteraceae bacterium]|nr:ABC transporter permease subunit [Geobacteraceae bacterium]
MRLFLALTSVTLRGILRDRMLRAILGTVLLLILLVPVFSMFSMRQVQELAITITLSAISFFLLVMSLLLGSSSVWRDIERRYTSSILTLPVSRRAYILGKFSGIAIFIVCCGLFLFLVSVPVIMFAASSYPSDVPVHWLNIALAIGADILKYLLVAALALLFSTISTSFFLPFFATIAVYLAGSASQEVFEYVSGQFGTELQPASVAVIKGVYYILPNFSAFNLKVPAIYGLSHSPGGLALTTLYGVIYVVILLVLAIKIFSRRQLP